MSLEVCPKCREYSLRRHPLVTTAVICYNIECNYKGIEVNNPYYKSRKNKELEKVDKVDK
jgi:hypothetical protein